ncbi:MAG: arginine repressor [Muribaculaceae bacterium]|nr:arginine repressor [Muribaculaceae bacterium]
MNSRKIRLPEIIDILTHNNISSQEELSKQLAVRGHIITQATLSRDLKLLKANKIADDRGGYRYIVGDSFATSRRNRQRVAPQPTHHSSVLSIAITGNLVVIKTRNGYASGLAYDIDMLESDLVLGTIPGADTVFVAVREGTPRHDLYTLFSAFIPAPVMAEAASMFQ